MLRRFLISLLLAGAVAPASAMAAEPPNQNDPCARGGRDICNTTGVGEYRTYKFGLRWFGDYRGAIRGIDGATFCLDLRFWYPGRAYDYELAEPGELRNRDGDRITQASLRRMNWAMWNYGRTTKKANQSAVMLYVHRLMGDGARGEVDPSALTSAARAIYARIVRDADRFAGPYRVELGLPKTLAVRRKAALEVRVLTASGRVVPNMQVTLGAEGAPGLPAKVDTGDDGVARLSFTPDDVQGGVRVTATTGQLATSRPRIYVPARRDAARNGQRLAVPTAAPVDATATAEVRPARLTVTTTATPSTLLAGQITRDSVTIGGAYGGWRGQVETRLYGPFRSQAAISCAGAPLAATTYATGAGPSMTPPLAPSQPGWYGYQLTIASTDDVIGVTTPCAVPAETFKVETQPAVITRVSSQTTLAGSAVTDIVDVTGLAGESVTVAASLFGPYAAPDKMTCAGPPFWTGRFVASADGSYVTDPVTLTVPGYYTYRESIPASDFVRAVDTPCAAEAETTIVRGKPQIRTQVSAQEAAPGAAITDSVVVSGLGALSATVNVALYGPFASRGEIRCDGAPAATSMIAATGDGTYTSEPTTLARAGYYTYVESIVPTNAYDGAATACGEVSETTFVRAQPKVTTVVSDQVVRPGSAISDRIAVTGLGQTPATIEVRLFGPYASRAAMDCSGTPFWKGTVDVAGDGETSSPEVTLKRAGFYTYRERIVGTASVTATETECGEETETSLTLPLILTGRGDRVVQAAALPRAAQATAVRPTRVRLAARGIDAPVYEVGIDTRSGALAIPKDIDRVAWWRDGASPGSSNGAILLAGHIDSARRGAGAFYALKNARRGDTVTVTSDDGKTREYRVSTMLRVRKAALPESIYSRTGRRRLVLVTCGGPFYTATGHYRDNLIVTAFPR